MEDTSISGTETQDVEHFEIMEAFIRPTQQQIKEGWEEFCKERNNHLVANDAELSTLATAYVGNKQELGKILADHFAKTKYPFEEYMTVSVITKSFFFC